MRAQPIRDWQEAFPELQRPVRMGVFLQEVIRPCIPDCILVEYVWIDRPPERRREVQTMSVVLRKRTHRLEDISPGAASAILPISMLVLIIAIVVVVLGHFSPLR